MRTELKPINPNIISYQTGEPLGLQILRVHGKEVLWEQWQKERTTVTTHAREGKFPEETFFGDPFALLDMDKAVACLLPLIKEKARILIHGDYDCDGITATSLLYRFLTLVGCELDYYIPDRLNEGYGLSETGLAYALETKPQLLITVDCGVQSFDEVEELEKAGIPVIITDHHVCLENLPAAHAVINPNRLDEGTMYKNLAGAGVALKLCQAINQSLVQIGSFEEGLWMQGLQYAALGTVADLMPLEAENRRIVMAGLVQIQFKAAAGLLALLEVLKLQPEQVRAKTLGFSIAPRINACGRMGSVAPAMELMLSDDMGLCRELAHKIEQVNNERREVETKVFNEALLFLKNNESRLESKIIQVEGRTWHPGVLGIVASRLVQYFQRPVIILSKENGDNYRGSARSIGSLDILSYLQKCEQYLLHYGGHHAAAGLEIKSENIQVFSDALREAAKDIELNDIQELPKYALHFTVADLELKLLDELDMLEPFGKGNEEPVFLIGEAILNEARAVGKDQNHLRVSLDDTEQNKRINGIAFDLAELAEGLSPGIAVQALARLQRNNFRGHESLDLLLIDIEAETSSSVLKEKDLSAELLRLQSLFPNWSAQMLAAPFAINATHLKPSGDVLKEVYLRLLAAGIEEAPLVLNRTDLEGLGANVILPDKRLGFFIVTNCLSIYEEAGLIRIFEWIHNHEGKTLAHCYNLQKNKDKVSLYDTKTYRKLSR